MSICFCCYYHRLVTTPYIREASSSIYGLADLGLNSDSARHPFLGSLLLWKVSIYMLILFVEVVLEVCLSLPLPTKHTALTREPSTASSDRWCSAPEWKLLRHCQTNERIDFQWFWLKLHCRIHVNVLKRMYEVYCVVRSAP
jgi:hypothetical protein